MYGDNTAAMRSELATLLQLARNHHTNGLTPGDINLIAAFRTSLTLWCQQAVRASNPIVDLGGTTPRSRGPAEELRHRLDQARTGYTTGLPDLDQLATPHPQHVVDTWRRAAKAAVLGVHDFPAGLSYDQMSDEQAMTVLKDAAEITRALTGLDRHYTTTIPSWEPITDANLLGRAAVVCAAHAGYTPPDYRIDHKGWRPPVQLADGPALPGLTGVLQAQNNLLFHLQHQPDGYSLRLILDSQRIVSRHAATLAQHDSRGAGFADRWAERARTYTLLVDQTRNLRGLVGHGHAAAEGAIAAARIQKLQPTGLIEIQALRHLDALFTHIDRRLHDVIVAGARDRSYLMRVTIPRIDLTAPGAVKAPRARHVPLDVRPDSPLLMAVANRLDPRPTPLTRSPRGVTERRAFIDAVDSTETSRRSVPASSPPRL